MSDNKKTVEIKETVKIIAVNKMYKEKPYLSCMPWDNDLRRNVNGLEGLTAPELAQCEFIPTIEDHFSVSNNDELVLTKKATGKYVFDKNYILFRLYSVDPNIANSRQEVSQSKHFFYMENYESEANKLVDKAKIKAKAGAKLVDLVTLTDIYDLLYYLGVTPTNLTHKRAEAALYEKVENAPERILEYFDNIEKSKQVVFVNKLLNYGFVKKNSNGYLLYEDITLGANIEEAATFLYDEKQSTIFNPLKDMVDKKENN